MAKFGDFCKVASSFADVADFVTVYIEEAHPADGWAFSNNVNINTHRKIEDRIEAAKGLLVHKPSFPIVCDGMAEEANYAYGGLYERLYIIHKGKIAYRCIVTGREGHSALSHEGVNAVIAAGRLVAELGRMHIRAGQMPFPDLPRF